MSTAIEQATTFLVNKFKQIPSIRNAYATEEEMVIHLTSGDVTVPFPDVVKYMQEYQQTIAPVVGDNQLPSQFQYGDKVLFGIQQNQENWICPMTAVIRGVHFYKERVKYDLEIGISGESPTRIYNIDDCFIQPYSEEAHRCYSIKDYAEKTNL